MAPLGHRGLTEVITFYYWRKAVISVLLLERCWNDTDRPLGQSGITAYLNPVSFAIPRNQVSKFC
jgi:hypothetical protein